MAVADVETREIHTRPPTFDGGRRVTGDQRRLKIDEAEDDRREDILRAAPEASVKRAVGTSTAGRLLLTPHLTQCVQHSSTAQLAGLKILTVKSYNFSPSLGVGDLYRCTIPRAQQRKAFACSQKPGNVYSFGTGRLHFPSASITARTITCFTDS